MVVISSGVRLDMTKCRASLFFLNLIEKLEEIGKPLLCRFRVWRLDGGD
jgi:hypothetical protein